MMIMMQYLQMMPPTSPYPRDIRARQALQGVPPAVSRLKCTSSHQYHEPSPRFQWSFLGKAAAGIFEYRL